MKDVALDMTKDMAPQITVTVRLDGVRQWAIRVWIGTRLIWLAGRIMNTSMQVLPSFKD